MVRAIILIATIFVAAVSAAPSPDPLIAAKAKNIGVHDARLNRLGRELVSAKRLSIHGKSNSKTSILFLTSFLNTLLYLKILFKVLMLVAKTKAVSLYKTKNTVIN